MVVYLRLCLALNVSHWLLAQTTTVTCDALSLPCIQSQDTGCKHVHQVGKVSAYSLEHAVDD